MQFRLAKNASGAQDAFRLFSFLPETNTLTLDGRSRARTLDEIGNGVARRFPIRI